VAWVEEVYVRGQERGRGIGRALMSAFERWAAARDCALIALATRRAAPFYRALGFEESAVYFRKVLGKLPEIGKGSVTTRHSRIKALSFASGLWRIRTWRHVPLSQSC
jgi:GNAT superfamily N-acetyltransferase